MNLKYPAIAAVSLAACTTAENTVTQPALNYAKRTHIAGEVLQIERSSANPDTCLAVIKDLGNGGYYMVEGPAKQFELDTHVQVTLGDIVHDWAYQATNVQVVSPGEALRIAIQDDEAAKATYCAENVKSAGEGRVITTLFDTPARMGELIHKVHDAIDKEKQAAADAADTVALRSDSEGRLTAVLSTLTQEQRDQLGKWAERAGQRPVVNQR